MGMTRTITFFHRQSGRQSWAVKRSYGINGPWVIQRSYAHGNGHWSFDAPLDEHNNFSTRKAAEEVKKTLDL